MKPVCAAQDVRRLRSKIVFMASVCVLTGLVGINNVMDYRANFQFVQHVLEMDTTFPGNPLL